MLGRVVILEDQKNGGVTSKTYLNVTLRMYNQYCLSAIYTRQVPPPRKKRGWEGHVAYTTLKLNELFPGNFSLTTYTG